MERRVFLSQISVASAAAAMPQFGFSSIATKKSYVEAEITHGRIRGFREEGVNMFKGIPYGGRISGDQRFRMPEPLSPWSGVRDALQLGAPAIQPPRRNEPEPSEDCLFLNVWTPANDHKKRPVMFYNHGGGFVIGSGGSAAQDGANLARNFDVVVVETNHRLGLLGFLYLDEIAGRKASQGGAPVYLYNFGYKSEKLIPGTDYPMGTPHAMDISFKFNNEIPPRDGSAPEPSFFGGNNPERFIASHNFAELWTTFAKTGKPAAKAAPDWPAYNLKERPTMRIDTSCEVMNNMFSQ